MLFQIKKVSLLKERKEILKNIELDIASGEILLVAGQNGAGKSTLFRK